MGAPEQHATLTGVSTVFGPRCTPVGGRLGTRRSAAAVYDVPLAAGISPYVRYGDWPAYGAVAALLVAAVATGGRAHHRRSHAGRTVDPAPEHRDTSSPVGS